MYSLEEILYLSDKLSCIEPRIKFRDMGDFYSFLKEYSFLKRIFNLPFSEIPINLSSLGYAGYRDWVDTILKWRLQIGR